MAAPELASAPAARAPIATAAATVGAHEATRKSRRRRVLAADGGGEVAADAKAGAGAGAGAGAKSEYECRFCFMKFEKSQALGGHMNRHRQEREKEQFHHAQEIVNTMTQHQIPRSWSSLTAEMNQSPSGPGGAAVARLNINHLSGGTTRQQFVPPPISFGSYRPTSPINCNSGTPLPPSPGPNCNYYLPSNASSCNIAGSSNANTHNTHMQNQQLQSWLGSLDGFSNATLSSPRSTPQSGISFHHPSESSMTATLQGAVVPSDFLASMLRSSGPTNGDGNLQVSPSTPTSPAPGTFDVIYNSQNVANSFFNGGMDYTR